MKIAVLFDGAGFARYGLEQAGHECTGFELDPDKHYLSRFIGSGNSILADATSVDLTEYEGIWLSPPCQWESSARTQGDPVSPYANDLLDWAKTLTDKYPNKIIWIENVFPRGAFPTWGKPFNAAQFEIKPRQNRPRIVGGNYIAPSVIRSFRLYYDDRSICPTITATEYKGCASDKRRASRWYGRKLTLQECAYHQGLDVIPQEWFSIPDWYAPSKPGTRERNWRDNLYEAIGNAVPIYMARAFGEVYSDKQSIRQIAMF